MEDEKLRSRLGPKVKAIANVIRRTIDRSTAELGITGAQSFILAWLSHNRGAQPCQHDLEVAFHIKHPTATGLLERLRDKGFVEFGSDRSDKRVKRVVITEAGAAAAKRTGERLDRVEKELVEGLSEEELSTLHRLLDRLVENAAKAEAACCEEEIE